MTTRHPMTQENLTKATQTADMLLSDLQQSLKTATHLESLLILDAMAQAAALFNRLKEIAAARD